MSNKHPEATPEWSFALEPENGLIKSDRPQHYALRYKQEVYKLVDRDYPKYAFWLVINLVIGVDLIRIGFICHFDADLLELVETKLKRLIVWG